MFIVVTILGSWKSSSFTSTSNCLLNSYWLVFLIAGRLQMLMLRHFVGREIKLPEVSKQKEEIVHLNSNVLHISWWLFCDKSLTTYIPSLLYCFVYCTHLRVLYTLGSPAVNTIQHGECVVASTCLRDVLILQFNPTSQHVTEMDKESSLVHVVMSGYHIRTSFHSPICIYVQCTCQH